MKKTASQDFNHKTCNHTIRSRTTLVCAYLFTFIITTHTLPALADDAIKVNVVKAQPVISSIDEVQKAIMGPENSLHETILKNFKKFKDTLTNTEDNNNTPPRYSLNFNLTKLIIDLADGTKNSNLSGNGKEILNKIQEAITPKTYPKLYDYKLGLIKNINNTNELDAATFLNTETYSSDEKDNKFDAAQNYFNYLTNLSPSLPALFPDPTDNEDQNNQNVIFYPSGGQSPINANDFKVLDGKLKAESGPVRETYIAYLLKYRSYMAARSLFLNNIWYSLAKRSQLDTKNKKSLAEIDRDQAYWRLKEKTKDKDGKEQDSYYDKLKSATPIDIQRDSAMMLAEMNRRLYELQQTEERILLTQSVNGLLNMSSSQITIDQQAQAISSYIECSLQKGTDCKEGLRTTPK